jgi:hypothetical protein
MLLIGSLMRDPTRVSWLRRHLQTMRAPLASLVENQRLWVLRKGNHAQLPQVAHQ